MPPRPPEGLRTTNSRLAAFKPTHPPARMPPFIVDLSQDSDDVFYSFPPKRAISSSPQKPQQKSPIRTAATVRKVRPPSSSIYSPSRRKPGLQAQITTFFTSPGVKQETRAPKPMYKRLSPIETPIHFMRHELDVDDIEAPVPDAFDFVETPVANKIILDYPMEIDPLPGSSAASPVVLTSSPPASPVYRSNRAMKRIHSLVPDKKRTHRFPQPINLIRNSTESTATARGGMFTIEDTPTQGCDTGTIVGKINDGVTKKRSHSLAWDKTPTHPLPRPTKATRNKATATANGGMLSVKYTPTWKDKIGNGMSENAMAGKINDGVSKRFRNLGQPAQTINGVSDNVAETSLGQTKQDVGEETVPQANSSSSSSRLSSPVYGNLQLNVSLENLSSFEDTDSNELEEIAISQKEQKEPVQFVCRAHSDPDCNEIECVSDFFDTYSPFHDTLPDDNQVEWRPARVQPSYLTIAPPPPLPPSPPPLHSLPPSPHPPFPPVIDAKIRKLWTEYISCSLASNSLDPDIRRPYLPLLSRDFLRQVRASPGEWEDMFKDSDGCLIHAGVDQRECEILGHSVFEYLAEHPTGNNDFPEPCESNNICEDLHNYLRTAFAGVDPTEVKRIYSCDITLQMDSLPGRIRKDYVDFLVDATSKIPDLDDPFILVNLSKGEEPKSVPKTKDMRRLFRELRVGFHAARMEDLMNDTRKPLQPAWLFTEGSSDILDIQWSSDGARFGMAAACFSDAYNRPGNLMLGTSNPWKVKMLYRHAFRVRQQQLLNLDKFSYATVSCIRFSSDNSLFYSGSYDGFVKTWDGKTGHWISNIPLKEPVLTMATSPNDDRLIAAATKSGSIHLIPLDEAGKPTEERHELHVSKEDEEKMGLYASCLVFGNKLHPNWLIAGYDTNDDGRQHGGLAIFDIETEQIVFGFQKNGKRMYNTRHFDIVMHQEGRTFVTAALQRPHKVHSPGIHSAIRVFDVRQMNTPVLLKSSQKDINRVTISPCQGYVTSSSTAGSTLVWDLRNPDKIMTELKHDVSKLPLGENTVLELDDTGVTFAQWGPYHDRLYTGSSDGIVKEWDITAGNPFIQDIAKVDTQIMSAAFSPSWDQLIVGECSGAATLFSMRGGAPIKLPVDWTENPDMMSPDDDSIPMTDWVGNANAADEAPVVVEEEEESGVRIARQLVEEGKMWIDGRWAWATDSAEMS